MMVERSVKYWTNRKLFGLILGAIKLRDPLGFSYIKNTTNPN